MPITQSRFLAVLNASADALALISTLRAQVARARPTILDANEALAHVSDPFVRQTLLALRETISAFDNILAENSEIYLAAQIAVASEQKYFARVGKANEKAAARQRLRRGVASEEKGEKSNGENRAEPSLTRLDPTDDGFAKFQQSLREHATAAAPVAVAAPAYIPLRQRLSPDERTAQEKKEMEETAAAAAPRPLVPPGESIPLADLKQAIEEAEARARGKPVVS